MPQFDPTYFASQIFWLLACFAFLLLFMGIFIVPRIKKGITLRDAFVEEALDREATYRLRINELEENIQNLKLDHIQKSKAFMDGLQQKLLQEKEDHLKYLHEKFMDERKATAETLSQEISDMRANLPSIAQEIFESLEEKLLGHDKKGDKRHAVN